MNQRKRHLMVTEHKAACGVVDPPLTTREVGRVTCGGCARTEVMADAEVRAHRKRTIRSVK